jgi:ATP-dependent helicase IRC3
VLDHFTTANSRLLLWGCTATALRNDAQSLAGVFDKICYHKDIRTMIKEGWLCDVRVVSVETSVHLGSVPLDKTDESDYQLRELSRRVNIPSRNNAIVNTWRLYKDKVRCTLVFAVDIAHVKALCEQFRQSGHHAEEITSKTTRVERRRLLDEFRSGSFPILVNCGILTEGTDVSTQLRNSSKFCSYKRHRYHLLIV